MITIITVDEANENLNARTLDATAAAGDLVIPGKPTDDEIRALANNALTAPESGTYSYFDVVWEEDQIRTAAATMGRKGGKSTSPAKTAAVRENGRKGGRPGYYHPTEAQIAALVEFKRHHGRAWKKELRFAWMKAGQGVAGYSAELQQLRNDPSRPESWLDRVVIE